MDGLRRCVSSTVFISGITYRLHGEIVVYLKGLDKIREKLPGYPGKKLAILPLTGIIVGTLGYIFLIVIDLLPRLYNDIWLLVTIEPYLPVIGSFFIAWLALYLIWGLWNKRDEMKQLYGELAYQKMIIRGVAGVSLVISVVAHTFTSVRSLTTDGPANPLTRELSTSIMLHLGIVPEIELWIRVLLGGVFFLLALLTVRSAILTFGFDYMIVIYLYFPEESEMQEHEIYSVIRHPTYLGGILFGISGFFFRFSVYSAILCLIVILLFRAQIWKEEKELVDRFGEGYIEYRKRVPAFLVRPSKLGAYFRFLRMRQ
jgi:protein-S-isoprenylcysteine O-methyltransferase Ste14